MEEEKGGNEERGKRREQEKQIQRERHELRGGGGNPCGRQRVLSDRLGLCK